MIVFDYIVLTVFALTQVFSALTALCTCTVRNWYVPAKEGTFWFIYRGNLDSAKKHFDESIEFAKTELELAHLYALRAAAVAQSNIASKYGLRPSIPTMM